MRYLPYSHQWMDKEDIEEVIKVLKSDWLTQGPKVEQFEQVLAKYCGAKCAVACSNGTSALHLAYLATGLKEGDEVITTLLTFAATSNTILHCGAKPVFVDVQDDTLNIDPKEIAKKITKKTKAIAVVDFAGHPCDLDEIKKIAEKHNLFIIEDAAHALGAEYKGKKIGSIADLTIFSFHPVKLLTTGEGGAVLTKRKDLSEKMKILRHHGLIKKPASGGWYYEIEKPGYNYRLTDFQCALGISQFKKINKFIKRRREIVAKYNQAFKEIKEIITLTEKPYVKSAWHIYPIQFRLEKLKATRKEIFDYFHKQGISVQVHYMPIHLHPFYKKQFGYKKGDFAVAENYYQRTITLPLFPKMTDKDVEYVIQVVQKINRGF